MIDHLLIHTAVITKESDSGDRDSANNPINPTQTEITYACRVEQMATTEDLSSRDTVITRYRVFFPSVAFANLLTTGTFVAEGNTHEIMGQPAPVYDGHGLHHVEVESRVVV